MKDNRLDPWIARPSGPEVFGLWLFLTIMFFVWLRGIVAIGVDLYQLFIA